MDSPISGVFVDADGLEVALCANSAWLLATNILTFSVTMQLVGEFRRHFPALASSIEQLITQKRIVVISVDVCDPHVADLTQHPYFTYGQAIAIAHALNNGLKIISGDPKVTKKLPAFCEAQIIAGRDEILQYLKEIVGDFAIAENVEKAAS